MAPDGGVLTGGGGGGGGVGGGMMEAVAEDKSFVDSGTQFQY